MYCPVNKPDANAIAAHKRGARSAAMRAWDSEVTTGASKAYENYADRWNTLSM